MPHRKSKNVFSLTARLEALMETHAQLEAEIAQEQGRPLPDLSRLNRLKRLKLQAKDEAASIEALLRVLGHGQAQRTGLSLSQRT